MHGGLDTVAIGGAYAGRTLSRIKLVPIPTCETRKSEAENEIEHKRVNTGNMEVTTYPSFHH